MNLRMRDDNGLLIASPADGVGYQTAGALQRLGRRMTGLLHDDEEFKRLRHVPMPTVRFAWSRAGETLAEWPGRTDALGSLLVTPEPELGACAPLSEERSERIESLVTTLIRQFPNLHVVYVLPESLTSPQVDRFRKLAQGSTVLLAPATFGFRDGALFDGALTALARNPALLRQPPQGTSDSMPLVFAGDVASFASDAAQRDDLRERVLAVPPTTRSLEEWTRAFRTAFAPDAPSPLQRLRAWREHWAPLRPLHRGTPLASALPALDFFPTVLTPLERALRESAAHHRRAPDVELVFPPGRSI